MIRGVNEIETVVLFYSLHTHFFTFKRSNTKHVLDLYSWPLDLVSSPVLYAILEGCVEVKVDGAHDHAEDHHNEELQDGSLRVPDQVLYRPGWYQTKLENMAKN